MAACADVLAIPGLVVGSVLLLVLSSNPVWGNFTTLAPNTHTNGTNDPNGVNITAIVTPAVIFGVLAIFVVVLVKKKRQTEGTYRPSAEEQSDASSVMALDVLKLPKEERLI